MANLGGDQGAGLLRALRGCSALVGGFGQPAAVAETAAEDFSALLAEARLSARWDEQRDGVTVQPASWAGAAKVIGNVATRVELDRRAPAAQSAEQAPGGPRVGGGGDAVDASGLPAGSYSKLGKASAAELRGAVSTDVAAGTMSRAGILAAHGTAAAEGVVAEAQRLAALPSPVGESARRMLASNGTVDVALGALPFDGKAPGALVSAMARGLKHVHDDILDIVGGGPARQAAVADDARALAMEVVTGRIDLSRVVRVLGGVKPRKRKQLVAQSDGLANALVGTLGDVAGATAAVDIERAMGHLGALLRRHHCDALGLGQADGPEADEIGLKALAASAGADLSLGREVELFKQLFQNAAVAFAKWRSSLRAPPPDWVTLVTDGGAMIDEQLDTERAEAAGARGAARELGHGGADAGAGSALVAPLGGESSRARKKRLQSEKKAARVAAAPAVATAAPSPAAKAAAAKAAEDKAAREQHKRGQAAAAAFAAANGGGAGGGGGDAADGGGTPEVPTSFSFAPGSLTQKFGKRGTPAEFVGCVNAFDSIVQVPGGRPADEPCGWRTLFPPCSIPGQGMKCRHCSGGNPVDAPSEVIEKVVAAMDDAMRKAHVDAVARV